VVPPSGVFHQKRWSKIFSSFILDKRSRIFCCYPHFFLSFFLGDPSGYDGYSLCSIYCYLQWHFKPYAVNEVILMRLFSTFLEEYYSLRTGTHAYLHAWLRLGTQVTLTSKIPPDKHT
jgi:hypothetical protein